MFGTGALHPSTTDLIALTDLLAQLRGVFGAMALLGLAMAVLGTERGRAVARGGTAASTKAAFSTATIGIGLLTIAGLIWLALGWM